MSTQYDLLPGVDFNPLGGTTKAQFLQAIAQMTPLPNIGLVIVMSGTAGAHPDVTNNPRFIRYVWIDTQVPNACVIKIYQGTYPSDTYADWSTVTIPDNSIDAGQLQNYAVTILNAAFAPKIAYNQDGTGDATKANYILRLDAAGRYVEIVSFANALASQILDPAKISPGSANQVLAVSGTSGVPAWTTLSSLISIAVNSLALNTLQYGVLATAGFILRYKTSGTYEVEAVSNDDSVSTLFPVHTIALTKLSVTGLVTGDLIRYNGTDWAKTTPYYNIAGPALSAAVTGNVAHGLGAVPRLFKAMIQYVGAGEAGYVSGNMIDMINFLGPAGNTFLGSTADATNLTYTQGAVAGIEVRHKTTGASTAITEAAYNWVFYASL